MPRRAHAYAVAYTTLFVLSEVVSLHRRCLGYVLVAFGVSHVLFPTNVHIFEYLYLFYLASAIAFLCDTQHDDMFYAQSVCVVVALWSLHYCQAKERVWTGMVLGCVLFSARSLSPFYLYHSLAIFFKYLLTVVSYYLCQTTLQAPYEHLYVAFFLVDEAFIVVLFALHFLNQHVGTRALSPPTGASICRTVCP